MQAVAIAQDFAHALDTEDYLAAAELLAPACVYAIGDTAFTSPAGIVETYRANAESAKGRFDSIVYSSVVKALSPSSAMILFTDRLRIADQWHEFHCQQYIEIGRSGLIEKIRHEELPAERNKLIEFEDRQREGH
jgi:hypothetical protein